MPRSTERTPQHETDQHLPLRAADCHLLMALRRDDMYGYALLQAMADDSRGAVSMDIGALYRALDRLMRAGLIGTSGRRDPEPSRGKPRRYYAITDLGRDVLSAELTRLERLLALSHGEAR
ncbi:MAG: PadR family transcriptional regulator [Acidobacteriota bacterium]